MVEKPKKDARTILSEIFEGVDAASIEVILKAGERKTYTSGDKLITQGKVEHKFFVLLEGNVDIYKTHNNETNLLDYLKPGHCFGELGLILDTPRTADVVASSKEVVVLEIDREHFDTTIKSNADALLAVVRLIIKRIMRQQEDQMIVMAMRKAQFEAASAAANE